MPVRKATVTGLTAVILWSTLVGFLRGVTQGLGPIGGAAMIYTCSSLLLFFVVGIPALSSFPRKYLLPGAVLFVAYEICLSLSIGFAHTDTRAIEVGMVNYLWPSLTLLFALIADKRRPGLLMLPGILLCFAGVGKVPGGEQGFSLHEVTANIVSNPLSYGMAFAGAIIWGVYCVLTKKLANGSNGITLFFALTAVALWVKFFFSETPAMHFSPGVLGCLAGISVAMGLGYAAWNVGILHGNVSLLAAASYFIPVISSLFAALLLGQTLGHNFWTGAIMVCAGSLLCWYSSRSKA